MCLARHLKQQVARLALKRTHLEPEALKCGGCGAGKGSRAGEGWAEAGDRLCGPEVAPDPDPRPSGGAEGHVSCPPSGPQLRSPHRRLSQGPRPGSSRPREDITARATRLQSSSKTERGRGSSFQAASKGRRAFHLLAFESGAKVGKVTTGLKFKWHRKGSRADERTAVQPGEQSRGPGWAPGRSAVSSGRASREGPAAAIVPLKEASR